MNIKIIIACISLILLVRSNVVIAEPYNFYEQINRLAIKYSVEKEKALRIMKCESELNFNAYNSRTIDIGIWQINQYWWEEQLKLVGFDINKPLENLEAGFYLLSQYGDKLWNPSRKCWSVI